MEKRGTIYDYCAQVLQSFGFVMICMNVFCLIFGEGAKDFSTMFTLGEKGVPVGTAFQYLLLSVLSVGMRYFYFTDVIIKKASIATRTVGMLVSIVLVIMCFIWGFGWFPVDMWEPWVGFCICFIISVSVSVIVSVHKERLGNKKLEEALERLKNEEI